MGVIQHNCTRQAPGMAVINAIKDYNASLPLVVLAGSPLAQLAREQGCRLWLKPLPTGPTIRTVR